jgi:hypothetical protein
MSFSNFTSFACQVAIQNHIYDIYNIGLKFEIFEGYHNENIFYPSENEASYLKINGSSENFSNLSTSTDNRLDRNDFLL